MAAFHALASASRRESGNLGYDIYRGIDDNQEFYIVEHWASPAALAAHERSEVFIHFGQSMLGEIRNAPNSSLQVKSFLFQEGHEEELL
jgi:quinol monooxygenase YgiN